MDEFGPAGSGRLVFFKPMIERVAPERKRASLRSVLAYSTPIENAAGDLPSRDFFHGSALWISAVHNRSNRKVAVGKPLVSRDRAFSASFPAG